MAPPSIRLYSHHEKHEMRRLKESRPHRREFLSFAGMTLAAGVVGGKSAHPFAPFRSPRRIYLYDILI